MPNRISAASPALPEPMEPVFSIIEDAGLIEVLLGIARLNAAELRALAASLEGAAESQASGSDRAAFIGTADILRRMAAELSAMEKNDA